MMLTPGNAQRRAAMTAGAIACVTSALLSTGCVAASTLSARTNHDWQQALSGVRYRQLEVALFDGRRYSGRLLEFDADSALIQQSGAGSVRLARADTREIQLVTIPDSTRNGTLIGAGIGAPYMTGVLTYLMSSGEVDATAGNAIAAPVIGAALGSLAGWAVDGLRVRESRTRIYVADGR